MCARDGGAELLAAYNHARARSTDALAAVDTAGKVVIADDTASVPLGVPGNTPAVDPAVRWNPRLPAFIDAVRFASKRASHNPDWIGSTQIFTHLTDEPSPIGIRPVFRYGNLVGHLISFGVSDGEQLPRAEAGLYAVGQPRRVVGVRENRMVLLRLPEVLFADSDGNEVWLSTDQGRLRAASSGLDKLDNELANAGFLRVHRQYIVNLNSDSRGRTSGQGRAGSGHGRSREHDGAGVPAERARGTPCAVHLRFGEPGRKSNARES